MARTLLNKLELIERRLSQRDLAIYLGVNDRSVRRWKQGIRTPDARMQGVIDSVYQRMREKRVSDTPSKKKRVFDRLAGVTTGADSWYKQRRVLDRLITFPVGLPSSVFLLAQEEFAESNNLILRKFLKEDFELMHTLIFLRKQEVDDDEDIEVDDDEEEEEEEGRKKEKKGEVIIIGQRLHFTQEGLEGGLTWALILEDLHGLKYNVVLVKIEYHGKTERFRDKPRGVDDAKKTGKRKNK